MTLNLIVKKKFSLFSQKVGGFLADWCHQKPKIMNSFLPHNFMNLVPANYVQHQNPFLSPNVAARTPAEFLPVHIQQQIDFQRLAAVAHLQYMQQQQQQVLQQLNVFSNSEHFHPNIQYSQTRPRLPFQKAQKQRSVSPIEVSVKQRLYSTSSQGEDSREGSPSSDICTEIKQEILKQLKIEKEGSEKSPGLSLDSKNSEEGLCESAEDNQIEQTSEEEQDMYGRSNINRVRGRSISQPYQKEQRPQRPSSLSRSPPNRGSAGNLTFAQLSAIDNQIMAYYNQNKQPEDVYAHKMQLRDALYSVMKGVFPYCGLYVVGSSMNGFGSLHSDMDLCLMLSHCEIDQRSEATEILRVLFKSLKACDFLREIQIIKAKVPILRFVDKVSNVECDLNINNATGIRNTHLLNAYSRCDWRLNPLVLYIKFWAKFHIINDAKNCTLSSYSLVLMVIHFLQVGVSPPVLPCLQTLHQHKFNPNLDIRTISLNEKLPDFNSQNNMSVGELFVCFLNYYANVFNFERDAISVRLGCVLPREVVKRQNPIVNPPSQWKCICIEEPFNLSNTSRSVYDQYIFTRIIRVFRTSFTRLRKTGQLRDIMESPF